MEVTARLRGVLVGAASGTVAIAAHAAGGGIVSAGRSPIALLVAACALVGAVVATVRVRRGFAELAILLGAGQCVGHLALTMSSDHHHGTHVTAPMLLAHLVAVPVGAVLIRGAELAVVRAMSSVRRTLSVLRNAPVEVTETGLVDATGPLFLARRLLVCSGIGTRGPPAFG